MHPFFPNRKVRLAIRSAGLTNVGPGREAREADPPVLVPHRLRCGSPLLRQQLRQHFFRAKVVRLAQFELFFRLHARGDGQKAIEAARVEAAVFVLCAAIHGFSRKYLTILGAIRIFSS